MPVRVNIPNDPDAYNNTYQLTAAFETISVPIAFGPPLILMKKEHFKFQLVMNYPKTIQIRLIHQL